MYLLSISMGNRCSHWVDRIRVQLDCQPQGWPDGGRGRIKACLWRTASCAQETVRVVTGDKIVSQNWPNGYAYRGQESDS